MKRELAEESIEKVDLTNPHTMYVIAFRHKTEHGEWEFIPRLYGWTDACYTAISKKKDCVRDGLMDPESVCIVPASIVLGWSQAIELGKVIQVAGKNFAVDSPPPPPNVVE